MIAKVLDSLKAHHNVHGGISDGQGDSVAAPKGDAFVQVMGIGEVHACHVDIDADN